MENDSHLYLNLGTAALGLVNDVAWANLIVDNRFKYGLNSFSYQTELISFIFALSIIHLISGLIAYSNSEKKMENHQIFLLSHGLSGGVVVMTSVLAINVYLIAQPILFLGGAIYFIVYCLTRDRYRTSYSWP